MWIHFADVFDVAAAAHPDQAVALLTAGASVLALPGTDDRRAPLGRGVAKLAAVLGVDADQVLDVDLGLGGADVLEVLRTAVAEHRRVHLDYYSYGRDARTERDVDPYLVHAEDGSLYVLGHCHLAGGERRFRVDRIAAATLLDDRFEPPATTAADGRVPARRRRSPGRARARRRRRRGWPRPTRSRTSRPAPTARCACAWRWRPRRGSSGCWWASARRPAWSTHRTSLRGRGRRASRPHPRPLPLTGRDRLRRPCPTTRPAPDGQPTRPGHGTVPAATSAERGQRQAHRSPSGSSGSRWSSARWWSRWS